MDVPLSSNQIQHPPRIVSCPKQTVQNPVAVMYDIHIFYHSYCMHRY